MTCLLILDPIPPSILSSPVSMSAKGCKAAYAMCVANSTINMTASFSFNGQDLSINTDIDIVVVEEMEGGVIITSAVLKLRSVTADSSGDYSCTFRNELGSDTANFTVIVINEPGIN